MPKGLQWLMENTNNINIATKLDESKRQDIAQRVVRGYDIDEASRQEWCEKTKIGLEIAEQITQKKTYPWPDSANVKFPLIATAAIQFAARAYPNIIQGTNVVKTKVVGEDLDGTKAKRAGRVGKHMSYQCTDEMDGWEEDCDKLLHSLPVIGTCFKKTYFSKLLQRNVSEMVSPLDLVVNQECKSMVTARRLTHIVPLYKNEVIEREMEGSFIELQANYMEVNDDEDAAEIFLEQHRWLDLDEDGYEEPYIVTVHKTSQTLVRIVARYEANRVQVNSKNKVSKIKAVEYFTMFGFIPAPSGKFYYLGFAHLLGPINESMNTLINQLLDAGSLANLQGGFLAKGIRFQGGTLRFKPGKWKLVDVTGGILKDNIYPLPVKEPSDVLFKLLGLLNDTGMKLASVSETMTGDAPPTNTPAATTLAMIEQGLKVFTAIYKRVYRSLTEEYRKLYRLNSLYLDDKVYFNVMDTQLAVAREDYNTSDIAIFPVADPTLASEAQRIAKSQALMQTMQLNPSKSGQLEILRQHYEALGADNIDKILPEQEIQQMLTAPPPPDPQMIEMQIKATQASIDDDIKLQKLPYELEKLESEIDQVKAVTKKILAEAASKPILAELDIVNSQIDRIQQDTKLEIERMKAERTGTDGSRDQASSEPRGTGTMASAPDDSQGASLPGPDPGQLPEAGGAGGNLESQLGGIDGTPDYAAIGEGLRRESGIEP
jgi:chaperonin GroES